MGTRGVLFAPYLSDKLFQFIENNVELDNEISINRIYTKNYCASFSFQFLSKSIKKLIQIFLDKRIIIVLHKINATTMEIKEFFKVA